MKLLKKMKSGLENKGLNFPLTSWNEWASQISFTTRILQPNTGSHDLSTYPGRRHTHAGNRASVCAHVQVYNMHTHTHSSWKSAHQGHVCLKTHPGHSAAGWKASGRGSQQGRKLQSKHQLTDSEEIFFKRSAPGVPTSLKMSFNWSISNGGL